MKKFQYKVIIEVADSWIEDGFDGRPEIIADLLTEHLLPYAYGHERVVKVEKIEGGK